MPDTDPYNDQSQSFYQQLFTKDFGRLTLKPIPGNYTSWNPDSIVFDDVKEGYPYGLSYAATSSYNATEKDNKPSQILDLKVYGSSSGVTFKDTFIAPITLTFYGQADKNYVPIRQTSQS